MFGKKSGAILLSLVFLSILVLNISFSGADLASNVQQGSYGFVNLVKGFFSPIISAIFGNGYSENVFETLLYFIIILAIVSLVLSRIEIFKDKKRIIWIISICIALLATRFTLEPILLGLVSLPYKLLGISILSVLPFIIYFMFLESFEQPLIRKIGWIFFICLYIGLWYSQTQEMGNYAYIYMATAIIGLIVMLFDRTIQAYRIRSWVRRGLSEKTAKRMADLSAGIDANYDRLKSAPDPASKKKIQDAIDRDVKDLKKASKEMAD
jgi:hypothetical protein